MPLIIGLTGGIGSGKTTVAKLFEALGIPVFYSDDEAKKVYSDFFVQQKVNDALGENLFQGGKLNRERLSELIFSDPDKRDKINGIIHPEVRKRFAAFFQAHLTAPYLINEAAILFEMGTYKQFHKNILVTAPSELKIQRVMKRDLSDREVVLKRMKTQWSDEQKSPLADFIIRNEDKSSLQEQVLNIHKILTGNS